MQLSDLRGALLRRWYVVLAGLGLTLLMVMLAIRVVPVTYESKALFVLLPPTGLVESGGNPYLSLGGLDSAASVLAKSMISEDTALAMQAVSPTATYSVDPDLSTSGPVLLVIADDVTPQGSLAMLDAVLDEMPRKFAELQVQSGAPEQTLITSTVITRDTEAASISKKQFRAVISAGALGIAFSLFAAAVLDGYLLRRRTRREGHEPGHDAAAATAPTNPGPITVYTGPPSHSEATGNGSSTNAARPSGPPTRPSSTRGSLSARR